MFITLTIAACRVRPRVCCPPVFAHRTASEPSETAVGIHANGRGARPLAGSRDGAKED